MDRAESLPPRAPANDASAARIGLVREHIRHENGHDLAAVMETFGPSARYDDEPWDEHHVGPGPVRSFYEQLLRALPDLEIVVTEEHASADAVVVECVIKGTHGGEWRDLPPVALASAALRGLLRKG